MIPGRGPPGALPTIAHHEKPVCVPNKKTGTVAGPLLINFKSRPSLWLDCYCVSANIEFRLSKHEAALLFCHHPPTIRSHKTAGILLPPIQPQKCPQTAGGLGEFSLPFLRILRLGMDRGLGRPLCFAKKKIQKDKKKRDRVLATTELRGDFL